MKSTVTNQKYLILFVAVLTVVSYNVFTAVLRIITYFKDSQIDNPGLEMTVRIIAIAIPLIVWIVLLTRNPNLKLAAYLFTFMLLGYAFFYSYYAYQNFELNQFRMGIKLCIMFLMYLTVSFFIYRGIKKYIATE